MSKHENLAYMKSKGINVPAFHVLTHDFLESFYQDNKGAILSKNRHSMLLPNSEKVSVRSSGNYSTPGRMETILNVDNFPNALSIAMLEVYRSSQSSSVQNYLKIKGIKDFEMNIIIQEMIVADQYQDWSGVLTTIHPITQTKQIYANCVLGQNGDKLMSGLVEAKPLTKVHDIKGINSLREQVEKIEKLFNKPQEIEFVVKDSVAYILQSRDFNPVEIKSQLQEKDILSWCEQIGGGQSATPFDCIGQITSDKSNCKGKILITDFTDFEDTDNIIDCLGIITLTGGTLSHAAIIAREFGKPCIVGARVNGQILNDDMIVMHHKGGIFKKK